MITISRRRVLEGAAAMPILLGAAPHGFAAAGSRPDFTITVADLPAWYPLYLATMSRNHLTPLPCAHFQAMLEERGEGSASPVQTRLLLATNKGSYVATLVVGDAIFADGFE